MFSRFQRARADIATMGRLFPEAERIAHADGLERPGAEHLLLASLDLDDSTALHALGEMGIDRRRLEDAVLKQHQAALSAIGIVVADDAIGAALPPAPESPAGLYRSEVSMQTAFQRAVELAKADHQPLRSGHVLLAAVEAENGVVARALHALGADRAEVNDRARRQLSERAR